MRTQLGIAVDDSFCDEQLGCLFLSASEGYADAARGECGFDIRGGSGAQAQRNLADRPVFEGRRVRRSRRRGASGAWPWRASKASARSGLVTETSSRRLRRFECRCSRWRGLRRKVMNRAGATGFLSSITLSWTFLLTVRRRPRAAGVAAGCSLSLRFSRTPRGKRHRLSRSASWRFGSFT